ncbi:MAG: phospholipase [Proteobacteria bacterium]|nr:phospholipase [Pseudomonadota bacterium]MBU1449381.1 phospholipase [Pseudomonadota bacterium]MBU2467939.1 phospholipase [Pseudomonadota bacterium]MBU2518307.1 phospholipase [Pseudomonadota bacterium]
MFHGAVLRISVLALLLSMSLSAFSVAVAGQHCGANGDWRSNLVPDRWPPRGVKTTWLPGGNTIKQVPVYKACIRHDECYDRSGATQKKCDRRFLKDMLNQCQGVYKDLLELPHLEACNAAAQGYYQAVAKYGGPAFTRAQAKLPGRSASTSAKENESRPNQTTTRKPSKDGGTDLAARQTGVEEHSNGRDVHLKWKPWGELAGVTGLATMHGTLYAYRADTSEVFTSPTSGCAWERLGVAPIGKSFAAGQGYLYLAGVLGNEIWIMRPKVKPWKKLGEAKGVAALAAGSARLIGWFTPRELLRSTAAWPIKWSDLGRVKDVLSLALDAGRIYCLTKPDLQLTWRLRNKDTWNPLGYAPAAGCLAAEKGSLFLAVPQTGQILRASAQK